MSTHDTISDKTREQWVQTPYPTLLAFQHMHSSSAFHCYQVLRMHANHLTGACFPRLDRIAKEMGCAQSTVVAALKTLRAFNVISSERRDQKGVNHYTINDISDWDLDAERPATRAAKIEVGNICPPQNEEILFTDIQCSDPVHRKSVNLFTDIQSSCSLNISDKLDEAEPDEMNKLDMQAEPATPALKGGKRQTSSSSNPVAAKTVRGNTPAPVPDQTAHHPKALTDAYLAWYGIDTKEHPWYPTQHFPGGWGKALPAFKKLGDAGVTVETLPLFLTLVEMEGTNPWKIERDGIPMASLHMIFAATMQGEYLVKRIRELIAPDAEGKPSPWTGAYYGDEARYFPMSRRAQLLRQGESSPARWWNANRHYHVPGVVPPADRVSWSPAKDWIKNAAQDDPLFAE